MTTGPKQPPKMVMFVFNDHEAREGALARLITVDEVESTVCVGMVRLLCYLDCTVTVKNGGLGGGGWVSLKGFPFSTEIVAFPCESVMF